MAKVLEVIDGAECSVETGIGWVQKVDEPTGRNASVEIRAEHLRKPVKSWCDTTNAALYDVVRDACAKGVRVSYRVVVKRKRGQPTDVPLEAIDQYDRIRDLEAVEPVAGVVAPSLSATAAQTAAQMPQDDSAGTSAHPEASREHTAQRGPLSDKVCALCGGSLFGTGPVRVVNGDRQHVECPGRGGEVDGEADTSRPARADAPREVSTGPGPRMAEGKPWDFFNSDGTLNPGSYAYSAAEGMVLLANDLLLARARQADTGDGFQPPTEGQIHALARRLLRAADRAQARLRDDGHVARMASSHSRCRAAVRASLEVWPVPPRGATRDELDTWESSLACHAGVLLAVTVALIDPEPLP